MTQISRPFQIALAAIVVIALVWFVALRGHSSNSSESSGSAPSTAAAPASATPATVAKAGSGSGSSGSSSPSSPTYHGSAPGVGGLTRAIAKARGAAAQSEQNAKRLARKEQQAASSTGSSQSSSASASAGSAAATAAQPSAAASHSTSAAAGKATAKTAPRAVVKPSPSPAAKARSGAAANATKAKSGVPAGQLAVEAQLKQGKDVAILLWNPKGSVDGVVRRELHSAGSKLHGKLVVHVALAAQVGSFGTFTRAVQVYSTPTILLIEPKGVTSSVTGLVDAFSIEQAVRELGQAQ